MLDQLKNPPIQYRIAPVWVWNQLPDRGDIESQVREMHSKGIGGFFIESHTAQQAQGLGEEILSRTQAAWDAAQRLGMQVYELDQYSAPSASPTMLDLKQRSSRAHAENRVRVHGQIRGKTWDLALEDVKREIDWQASLGASFFSPYAMHHSIAGANLALSAPSQFYQATYWRHYKALSDYAARLSYVMSLGRHCAQAVVIRPGSFDEPPNGEMAPWIESICRCLLAQHVDFDILDESTLRRASCNENRLMLADESYELVIVPPMPAIAYEAASKLCAFVEEEGKVIVVSSSPAEDSEGSRHAGVREAFSVMREIAGELFLDLSRTDDVPNALNQALRSAIKPKMSIRRGSEECPDIITTHRHLEGLDVFFLANHSSEAVDVRISVRCDGAPLLVNLESGDVFALPNCTQQGNRTVLLHRMEKYGSLMMAFGEDPAWSVSPPSIDEGQEIALSDEWEFLPDQPNCVGLPDWTFNTLIQADREQYEYTTSFQVERVPEKLMLVIEEQPGFGDDDGRILAVNETQLAAQDSWIIDIGFRTFDVTHLACAGTNTVRMLVERQGWTGDPVPSPARARLAGAFSVGADGNALREPPLTIHNGSWTEQGYPFYSGSATYRQVLYVPEFARGQRIVLRAEGVADMAEFLVNGAIASVRPWAPYEADITPLAKPGPNVIELRVTNSMANALLLQSKPSGLLKGAVALLA